MKELRLYLKSMTPFWIALASMAVYYLSLPPVGLRYTIFLVPAVWTPILAADRLRWRRAETPKPAGFMARFTTFPLRFISRGEYRQYWLASFIFWCVTVVWVSYPHPATILGWLALSGYLAVYFPLFIMQTRALRTLRLPLWLAASASWLACEALRNVVMGGFSFAGLSHAIYDVPKLIQIADFFGEYGVGVTIMLVGSLLGCGFFGGLESRVEEGAKASERHAIFDADNPPEGEVVGTPVKELRSAGPRLISFALMILLASYIYGYTELSRLDELENESLAHGMRPARLALLQDGTTYRFPVSKALTHEVEDNYLALAHEAAQDPIGYDAIVWPEGTYPGFFMDFRYGADVAATLPPIETRADRELPFYKRRYGRDWVLPLMRADRLEYANLSARLKTPAILGMASAVFDEEGKETSYNAAIYVPCFGTESESAALASQILEDSPASSLSDDRAKVFRRYDKVHLVMFGEYIPFSKYLPDSWGLKAVCANAALGRGRGPSSFLIPARDGGFRYTIAPHICFESAIPHFITNQLAELRGANVDPDILLNISNDGWFRNGSETDMHLATMVFRAVENRRALVTATHGGFSAYVDAGGRVRAKGSRGGTEVVDARVPIVKIHPRSLVRRGAGEDARYICVPDVMRRLGFVIFVVSVLAQVISVVVKRRRQGREVK